tara:strand:+ start:12593 stop:12727 length:135 start_codon:yes stop_codon:yes gene_type:complete
MKADCGRPNPGERADRRHLRVSNTEVKGVPARVTESVTRAGAIA